MKSRWAVLARQNSAINMTICACLNDADPAFSAPLRSAAEQVMRHILHADLKCLKLNQPSLVVSHALHYESAVALWHARRLIDQVIEDLFRADERPEHQCTLDFVGLAHMFNHQANHQWKVQSALDPQLQSAVSAHDLLADIAICSFECHAALL
jgi:hypothetical protein